MPTPPALRWRALGPLFRRPPWLRRVAWPLSLVALALVATGHSFITARSGFTPDPDAEASPWRVLRGSSLGASGYTMDASLLMRFPGRANGSGSGTHP